MEQTNFNQFDQNQKLPNATAVLVLGILSIITCLCYGIVGLILGIIALFLYKSDMKLYQANPSAYSNYSNLNTGRILVIIGIALNILSIIYFIYIINMIGWENLGDMQKLQERARELQGR
jgi:heme/copper-type cytochrome/quinol oxidase subunit 2